MDLPVISMSRHEARQAFLEYRASVRKGYDREVEVHDEAKLKVIERMRQNDEALMRGYRLLSLGRQIIVLADAIKQGGTDTFGRPKLAVARADATSTMMRRWRDGSVTFDDGRRGRSAKAGSPASRWFSFPAGTFERQEGITDARATVPTIPPRFRPADLSRYAILWEADWKAAPRDPALLRSLGGGMYAVLAVWDLTEIERAVLGMVQRPS